MQTVYKNMTTSKIIITSKNMIIYHIFLSVFCLSLIHGRRCRGKVEPCPPLKFSFMVHFRYTVVDRGLIVLFFGLFLLFFGLFSVASSTPLEIFLPTPWPYPLVYLLYLCSSLDISNINKQGCG